MTKVKHPKICILMRRVGPYGGLEKAGLRIAEAFARRGVHVTILTASKTPGLKLHPLISFQILPAKGVFSYRQIKHFDHLCAKWLANNHFDVIFGMDRTRFQTHIRAGNGVHAAYLKQRAFTDGPMKRLTHPINPLHQLILKIEKEAFESPHLKILFTNSYMVRKDVLQNYDTDPSKIHVVHNGVEWREMEEDFLCWIDKKNQIAKNFNLDSNKYHFLFIGNGYNRKGLIPFLNALSLLPTRDIHLSVVGKEQNISYFASRAKQLGLLNQTTFFGPQKNIRPFYQLADCLVIPSFYDPFANVTVEALAMGLFVVSSKYNGGYEVLKEENGAVIPALLDREAFARTLTKSLVHPKTWIRSQQIRDSVKYLNFNSQLNTVVNDTMLSLNK